MSWTASEQQNACYGVPIENVAPRELKVKQNMSV
jgi:hypothetical protein